MGWAPWSVMVSVSLATGDQLKTRRQGFLHRGLPHHFLRSGAWPVKLQQIVRTHYDRSLASACVFETACEALTRLLSLDSFKEYVCQWDILLTCWFACP